jgi:lysylphosphatidylglycerol synthetase-like protein (DUF2156 family)
LTYLNAGADRRVGPPASCEREEDAMTELLTETDLVLDAIQRHPVANNPSAFLALNDGNSYFHVDGVDGVVVYREFDRYLVQFAGPFAPLDARRRLLQEFVRFAAAKGKEIVAVQIQDGDAPDYVAEGFTVNQMGGSFAVELERFTLAGTAFMQLRNKISRALRTGMVVREVPLEQWHDAMRELDQGWLGTKGEGVKPLEFLVGEYGGRYQPMRRVFVGVTEGRLMAYITYSPVYGKHPGWLHDLSRRQPDSPPGVMEAINKTAIDTFIGEGVPWLHFGFTPFCELETQPKFPGYSKAFHWFMSHLWANSEAVYPAQTQHAYKHKWNPTLMTGEYIGFQHGASIPALVHIFRACNAI